MSYVHEQLWRIEVGIRQQGIEDYNGRTAIEQQMNCCE